MSQIFNIFRKDTRRFWPEILISIAITAALAWLGPYQWRGDYEDRTQEVLRGLAILLDPLMLISWVLVISRVVHAEPLVGDRQFWVTRPIEWKKLLASKLLFVAAYLYLPFLLMQCVLLARAGFSPAHWIPGLLLNLLLVSASLVLPLVALATITSGFGRIVLILIGILLGLVILEVVLQVVIQSPLNSPDRPIGNLLSYALAAAICSAAVLVQYSRRRPRLALLLLVGLCAACIAIFLVGPDHLLVDRTYPRTGSAAPVVLTFDADAHNPHNGWNSWNNGRLVGIEVPLRMSGVADGYTMLFDDVKFTLHAANGMQWTSGWQHLEYPSESGGENAEGGGSSVESGRQAWIRIVMPQSVYDQFSGVPLQVHLALAVTQAKISSVTQISDSLGGFSLPGLGFCEAGGLPNSDRRSSNASLSCRSPLRVPLSRVSVWETYRPCPAEHSASSVTRRKLVWSNWSGSSDAIVSDFFLVPIANRNESIGGAFFSENGVALCPVQASLTFTQYQPVRRAQVGLTIEDFRLRR